MDATDGGTVKLEPVVTLCDLLELAAAVEA